MVAQADLSLCLRDRRPAGELQKFRDVLVVRFDGAAYP